MEYEHIININDFRRKVKNYNSTTLTEYMGEINDDLGYTDAERAELMNILVAEYEVKKAAEDRAIAEREAAEAARAAQEEAERQRRERNERQQQRQRERRNRPLTEYSDEELLTRYNTTVTNIERMVRASSGRTVTKESLKNYNEMRSLRDRLKAEIDKRGLVIVEPVKVKVAEQKLRTNKEKKEIESRYHAKIRHMNEEQIESERGTLQERIDYIKKQLSDPKLLDSELERKYRLDLQFYEIQLKIATSKLEKIKQTSAKTQAGVAPTEINDGATKNGKSDEVAKTQDDSKKAKLEIVNDTVAPEIPVVTTVNMSEIEDSIRKTQGSAQTPQQSAKPAQSPVNPVPVRDQARQTAAPVSPTAEPVRPAPRPISPAPVVDVNAMHDKSASAVVNTDAEQVLENAKQGEEVQGKRKFGFLDRIRYAFRSAKQKYAEENQNRKSSRNPMQKVALGVIAVAGATLTLVTGIIVQRKLNEGKPETSISMEDDSHTTTELTPGEIETTITQQTTEREDMETTIQPTTTIEEDLTLSETTAPWELPPEKLSEIVEKNRQTLEDRSKQQDDDEQKGTETEEKGSKHEEDKTEDREVKLELGSVLESLPEGLEYQEGMDGGRIGHIGNESSPTDGFYVIDRTIELDDGNLQYTFGLDGTQVGDESSMVHISYVEGAKTLEEAQRIIEENKGAEHAGDTTKINQRGWVKTSTLRKAVEQQQQKQTGSQQRSER